MFVSKKNCDELLLKIKLKIENEKSCKLSVENDDLKKQIKDLEDKLLEKRVNDIVTDIHGGGGLYPIQDTTTTDLVTGRKIFKENAIKAIKITEQHQTNWNYWDKLHGSTKDIPEWVVKVEEGYTEEKPSKGKSYRLIQE